MSNRTKLTELATLKVNPQQYTEWESVLSSMRNARKCRIAFASPVLKACRWWPIGASCKSSQVTNAP